MGATFSQPTYFYEEGTKPDLVDTNGPIYARTGTNLGNVIPDKLNTDSDSITFTSSDIKLLKLPFAIMPDGNDNPQFYYKLYGEVSMSKTYPLVMVNRNPPINIQEKFELTLAEACEVDLTSGMFGGSCAFSYLSSINAIGTYAVDIISGSFATVDIFIHIARLIDNGEAATEFGTINFF